MADSMAFPKTMEEFIDGYSFNDSDKVYTNGVDLIPVYRVVQGFGHYEQEIRNKAIDEFAEKIKEVGIECLYHCNDYYAEDCNKDCEKCKREFKEVIDEIAEQMKKGE